MIFCDVHRECLSYLAHFLEHQYAKYKVNELIITSNLSVNVWNNNLRRTLGLYLSILRVERVNITLFAHIERPTAIRFQTDGTNRADKCSLTTQKEAVLVRSRFNILSPTAMAFPFLVLARFHHLTGRPGPLTENFSTSGSLLVPLFFHPLSYPFLSLLFVAYVRAGVRESPFPLRIPSLLFVPKEGLYFKDSPYALTNRFLTDCSTG